MYRLYLYESDAIFPTLSNNWINFVKYLTQECPPPRTHDQLLKFRDKILNEQYRAKFTVYEWRSVLEFETEEEIIIFKLRWA